MPYLKEAEEFKRKLRDRILGIKDEPTGEILLPQYKNFFQDVHEFISDLRNAINEGNIIIAITEGNGGITLSFHFNKIPALTELEVFQVNLDEIDLKEPDANTLTVIIDAVKGYVSVSRNPK